MTGWRIRDAHGADDIETVRRLFRAYEAFLDFDLCFQNFEEEHANLPGEYVPPTGALLVAETEGGIVGCVCLRKLNDQRCEMKRMYLDPAARGTGIGRALAEAIVERARAAGYREMVLDTVRKLTAAIALYRSLGFEEMAPYYHNPEPDVLYLQLAL